MLLFRYSTLTVGAQGNSWSIIQGQQHYNVYVSFKNGTIHKDF